MTLTVATAAQLLGISWRQLERVIHGHSSNPDLLQRFRHVQCDIQIVRTGLDPFDDGGSRMDLVMLADRIDRFEFAQAMLVQGGDIAVHDYMAEFHLLSKSAAARYVRAARLAAKRLQSFGLLDAARLILDCNYGERDDYKQRQAAARLAVAAGEDLLSVDGVLRAVRGMTERSPKGKA